WVSCAPPPQDDEISFDERVELMMRHVGLTREEAEIRSGEVALRVSSAAREIFLMSTNGVSIDKTSEKQHRWKPGQSGNPAGRPKGARSKLSETFLKALSEDFATNGIEVVEKVRNDRPHEYLKIVAAVLPKQMQLEDLTPNRRAEDL